MTTIKYYNDELGYPHVVQVLDKDTPPENGYELGLNYRYWFESVSLIPQNKAVKLAQAIFKRKWYYAHDLINVAHRHELYVLLKNMLGNEKQAKSILAELVYKLTKEEIHGKHG